MQVCKAGGADRRGPKGLEGFLGVDLGRGCTPSPTARESGEHCKLLQWVQAQPGWQAILLQFRVKKASLVIPFHEFVGNNYFEYDDN